MASEIEKKLPLTQIFSETAALWKDAPRLMWGAVAVVWIFLETGFDLMGGWQNVWFLPWAAAFYIFWTVFLRFLFSRQPLFMGRRLPSTLIPATKIAVLAFILATVFVLIPYAPYIMDVPVRVKENYSYFQQRYMQDSEAFDLVLNLLLTLALPCMFIRPLMAWIGSVIGRSWSILSAWKRTRDNYFRFLFLALCADAVFWLLNIAYNRGFPLWGLFLLLAPLLIFAVSLLSRIYNYFFLDIDTPDTSSGTNQ